MEDRLTAGTSRWRRRYGRSTGSLADRPSLRAGGTSVLAATDRFALTALASLVLAVGAMVGNEDARACGGADPV